jgi:hypothetical protein
MIQLELTHEETALILDALATLPLARSYNLFNAILAKQQLAQRQQAEQRQRIADSTTPD